jgi:hypothetical protein
MRGSTVQIQIVDEGFLLVPDIDEGSIEIREDLLHLTQVHISHRILLPSAGLRVVLDQPMILHQGDVYFCRCYIDNQVLVGFFRLHQEICFWTLRQKGFRNLRRALCFQQTAKMADEAKK